MSDENTEIRAYSGAKRGRKKRTLSKKDLATVTALSRLGMPNYKIAEAINICEKTFYNMLNSGELIQLIQSVELGQQQACEDIIKTITMQAKEGSWQQQKMILAAYMPERFGDKRQIDFNATVTIAHEERIIERNEAVLERINEPLKLIEG